jgi:nucleotide-binding universal stress UspA family protein
MEMETALIRPLKMIVPLDGSELAAEAIDYAVSLSANEADIVLVSVLPPTRPVRGLLGDVIVSAEGVLSRLRADVTAKLEKEADRLCIETPGIAVSVCVKEGDPAEEIINAANAQSADLIVMASHGRGAVGRFAFGSVADRVARFADTPVMIIRPQDAQPERGPVSIHRLLVPLDGSELADQAIPFAESMAKWLSMPIHLISGLDISQLTSFSLATGGLFSDEFNDEFLGGFRQDMEQKLEKQATSLRERGIVVDWEIVDGHAVSVIENAARDGDIIMMTSHGRGGIGRWVFGSVAEKLLRHCPEPLILIRSMSATEKTRSSPKHAA